MINKCPICGSTDHIQSDKNSAMCINCGYYTTVEFIESTGVMHSILSNFPQIVGDYMKYDGKYYWLPIILNEYPKQLIYPNAINQLSESDEKLYTNLKWIKVFYEPIPVDERINYPIDLNNDEFYEYRINPTTEQSYDTFNELYNSILNTD